MLFRSIKRTVGDYWFAGLYLQSPSPMGGGIFRRSDFRYFFADEYYYYLKSPLTGSNEFKIVPIKDCSVYASVDLAVSLKQTADYTVVLIFAVTQNGDILVLDIIRERFEGPEHLNLIRKVNNKWHPVSIGVENVQYQVTLIQAGMREGLPIVPLKPDRDKLTRALPIAGRLQEGMVFFLENVHWLECFENELLQFPNGAHDDQVDAFAYAVRLFSDTGGSMPAGAKKRERKVTDGFAKNF